MLDNKWKAEMWHRKPSPFCGQTHNAEGAVHWLIKMYVAGARLAFGQEFMAEKGIFHRLLHLPQQAQGDAYEIESTLRYSDLRL